MRERAVIVFAHERTDARVIKRVKAFSDHGWQATGFTFHRPRPGRADAPEFTNVPLGVTRDRAYGSRVLALIGALGVLWRKRAVLRDATALYAINTDNALLAMAARVIARRRLPLFVEIADIQPPFIDPGMKGRGLRWIERRVLAAATCLVTTSPGFVRGYFEAMQGYRGEILLLENKVYPSVGLTADRAAPPPAGPPWRIGWFGALRCRRSWDAIQALARQFPDSLRFVVRGYPTAIDADTFFREVSECPNIEFGGSYRSPDDLAAMHRGLHFVWAFDFSDESANSRWLLPNRLYESGLFHVPVLAAADTETGNWVASRGVGAVVNGGKLTDELAGLFTSLTAAQWHDWQARAAARPDGDFIGDADYAGLSDRMARP